ncbi:peptidylprolyl isomerase [Vibrio maerlii]|uniref:peptidylprolyl isomerase n=1 Tax=Vibrio maerlii TaxID=2231648 RepID=UPI000E3D19CD|nr:peptidylprolyl isomerase [Vibrio maerlii]
MKWLALPSLLLASFTAWAAPQVHFETTLGEIVIEVNEKQAPISAKNFIRYVEDGSYVGSQFHRVIPGFMAQGGGFDQEMNRLPTYAPIPLEADNGLKNLTGTVAMARTNNPDSATRQFFINYADNNFLDADQRPPGYAVFGKVVKGMDVVEQMAQKPTRSQGRMRDVPVEPIIITKATLIIE